MRPLSIALVLIVTALSGCSSSGYGFPGRNRSDRDVYRSPRNGPAGRASDRYAVCHNGRILTVPGSAVRAHLAHGDRAGSCDRRDDRRRDDRRRDDRRRDDRRDHRHDDRHDDRHDHDDRRGRGRGRG